MHLENLTSLVRVELGDERNLFLSLHDLSSYW